MKELIGKDEIGMFVDNHDVTRIASILEDKNNLFPVYGLLFGMPAFRGDLFGVSFFFSTTVIKRGSPFGRA